MLETKIYWALHNHCSFECNYCPSYYWNGTVEKRIEEYLFVAEKIINHYKSIERQIDWTFDGGEPLEIFDLPMLLKLCKSNNGKVTLVTNGGKLWLDWMAIEPNIDNLILTYHYWQNKHLINYILSTFEKKSKSLEIIIPFRPGYVNEDLVRANEIESNFSYKVSRQMLNKDGSWVRGLLQYTEEEILMVKGKAYLDNYLAEKNRTYKDKVEESIKISPSYTGKLCNEGIEKLSISHNGYVNGSNCRNTPLGRIWDENFSLPSGPNPCKMQACVDTSDQQITKFN